MQGTVVTCRDCLEREELGVEEAVGFSQRGGRCASCGEHAETWEDRIVRPPASSEAVLYLAGQRPLT